MEVAEVSSAFTSVGKAVITAMDIIRTKRPDISFINVPPIFDCTLEKKKPKMSRDGDSRVRLLLNNFSGLNFVAFLAKTLLADSRNFLKRAIKNGGAFHPEK